MQRGLARERACPVTQVNMLACVECRLAACHAGSTREVIRRLALPGTANGVNSRAHETGIERECCAWEPPPAIRRGWVGAVGLHGRGAGQTPSLQIRRCLPVRRLNALQIAPAPVLRIVLHQVGCVKRGTHAAASPIIQRLGTGRARQARHAAVSRVRIDWADRTERAAGVVAGLAGHASHRAGAVGGQHRAPRAAHARGCSHRDILARIAELALRALGVVQRPARHARAIAGGYAIDVRRRQRRARDALPS